jgi:hypothetical protein
MSRFQRLIRFQDAGGDIHYGELGNSDPGESGYVGLDVNTYEGDTPWSEKFHLTGKKATVEKVSLSQKFVEITGS